MSPLQSRASLGLPDDEHAFNQTRGLCNSCGDLVEARIVFRGAKVYIVKWCPSHGRSEGLVSSDREYYLRSLSFIKPGQSPKTHAVCQHHGCPQSCGLCPEHEQHTCVPILEITGDCNLACPACLVGTRVQKTLSVEQVTQILDRLVAFEGRINMLTLSGGEPTTHPRFLDIVDRCLRPEIGLVSVSTNGLVLSQNEDLLKALRDRGVVISLQLDGFRPSTYQTLRGKASLADDKRRFLDLALALGSRLSLTLTLAKGVNEGELPEVIATFLGHDEILSLMVQPLARPDAVVESDDLTLPDVIRRLADSSGGVLRTQDFTPLPCSHPTCFALTYLLKLGSGSFVSLGSILDTDTYLDLIKNQALFCTDTDALLSIRDALYGLWTSDAIIPKQNEILATIRRILLDLNRLSGSHRDTLLLGARNVKSIFIHHFMGRANFDLSRAVKCCNHYPQADGRLLPACMRNNGLAL